MVIKYTRIIGVLAVSVALRFLSACSSQPTGSTQTSAASSASGKSSPECEIDAKRICQESRKGDVVNSSTGITEDATRREQNAGVRTETTTLSFPLPSGSLAEIECETNIAHHSVVYAHVLRGPKLTDADLTMLQSSGYCVH
jgi:starvation-inducible outer membrane lipoprotein